MSSLILIEDLMIQVIHIAVDRYIYHIHYCDVHTDLRSPTYVYAQTNVTECITLLRICTQVN